MYQIWGKYLDTWPREWELLDEFDTRDVATDALVDYRSAYGNTWLIEIRKSGK